jgi:(p)ppGpp synthase/HD superfamily hydrolase
MILQDYNIIRKCSDLAAQAHNGQFRKDGFTPYITHPARVAYLASQSKISSPEVSGAGWLHDVIEDCSEDSTGRKLNNINGSLRGNLYNGMPQDIADKILMMVIDLTCPRDDGVSKKERKKRYYNHLKKASDEVAVIKFCDRIDNLLTVDNFSDSGREYYLNDTVKIIETIGPQVRRTDNNIYNMLLELLRVKSELFNINLKMNIK